MARIDLPASPPANRSSKPRVLVTRRWPKQVEARVADHYDATFNPSDTQLSSEALREAMLEYDAVLPTGTDRLGPETLDVPKAQTKILSNFGVGTSHICETSARKLGLAVTNTPDVLSECTADFAMTLMLMVARRVNEATQQFRNGAWENVMPSHLTGTKVSGKVLGLVGFGSVGREMARRAHHGFGMQVLVYDNRIVPDADLAAVGAQQVDTLEDLLPQCDFVSLHCSGGGANRGLINGRRLDQMKETAVLVNAAHADLIDTHALTQALMFETIGGAALEMNDRAAPLPPLLRDCDNLVLVPALAAATQEARMAMGFRALDNLNDFFEGRTPRDRVI